VAAIGRIAARVKAKDLAVRSLCPLVSDPHPYVRANALAALARAGGRCSGGEAERVALTDDPSEDVRAAAAWLLARAPSPVEARALERCARNDPSGAVAVRCRSRSRLPERTHAALVYVVADGATAPHPGAPYTMLLADGMLHAGTTDRRGAVFDPVTPEGDVSLRPASALAR
jgi:hypothetical protein